MSGEPGYAIRAYQASDADRLAQLYRRSVLHYGPSAYSPAQAVAWAATISAEKIASRISDGRYVAVAADEAGNILGWGDLEADGHIDFLYSAPEANGRRVGSTLYEALERQALAAAMPRLYVEASELARPLFERRGFVLLHRNELVVDGVPIHNFSLEKKLA
jgi:putative acetyltransferase